MAKRKSTSTWQKLVLMWLITRFWPWFVKNIWPHIEEYIIEIFRQVLAALMDRIFKFWQARSKNRSERAKHKAEEAEQKARNSHDQAEAEKWWTIAQVWREVAEQFRQDNEALRAKLEEQKTQSTLEFEHELKAFQVDDLVKENEDGTLQLTGPNGPLQLPSPSDK